MTQFTVIIPARYKSERLPAKPLLDIAGKPMIQHVYERAAESSAARVIVATDDRRIEAAVRGFGGEARLTATSHASGTDRLYEVVSTEELDDEDVVVNVQGDEPLIPPRIIDQVAENIAAHAAEMATLSEPIAAPEELFDPNCVKVVTGKDGFAIYFSRAAIPYARGYFDQDEGYMPGSFTYQRHLGIYAYRAAFLGRFVAWPPADIEQLEKLEQLRALTNGARIHVAPALEPVLPGVDTQADLDRVTAHLAGGDAAHDQADDAGP